MRRKYEEKWKGWPMNLLSWTQKFGTDEACRLRDVPFESVLKLADLTLHHKGSGCLEILAKV